MYTRLLLAIVIGGLLFACKKTAPTPAGLKANLINKQWQVTKVKQAGMSIPIYQNPLPAGQSIREDYSRYRLEFISEDACTVTYNNGQVHISTWTLGANETMLFIDQGVVGSEKVYTILQHSPLRLIISYTERSTKTGNRDLELELSVL